MSNLPHTLDSAVQLLTRVYSSSSNGERKRTTDDLFQLENALSAEEAATIGVGLLQVASAGAAVQAYGAVLLRHAVHTSRVLPSRLPYWDLVSWYSTEPTLGRLLCTDLAELLVECILHFRPAEPEMDNLIARIIERTDQERNEQLRGRQVALLEALVHAIMDPNFDRIPRERIGSLRTRLLHHSTSLLNVMSQALYKYYVASGQDTSTGFPSDDMERGAENCISVIGLLAPASSFQAWCAVSLTDTMCVLLRWTPVQRAVVQCAAALLRSCDGTEPGRDTACQSLLATVLESVPNCVATADLDALCVVLELLDELPRPLVESAAPTLLQYLPPILTIPSIQMALQVVSDLGQLSDESYQKFGGQLDVLALFEHINNLVPKNQFHPDRGTVPLGVTLSIEQIGFAGLYEQTFNEFRNMSGRLLERLASMAPSLSNQFTLTLLNRLPDSAGTRSDKRTPGGYVSQSSPTFTRWESTEFMVEHLSVAFSLSSDFMKDCIDALVARRPTDAVLLPVFLNMLCCLWKCGEGAQLNVWEGTLTILFAVMNDTSLNERDLDASAARRRAYTLLVRAATDYGHATAPLAASILPRMQPLFLSARGIERALVYEALAGFTAALPTAEGDAHLQKVLNPVLMVLEKLVVSMTQSSFNQLIVAPSVVEVDARDDLRDGLSVVAAIMRRCRMSPYILERINQLVPMLTRLLQVTHSIRAEELPPQFRRLSEQDEGEQMQYLPGQQRKSTAHISPDQVSRAYNALTAIRLSIYQIYGALAPFMSTGQFSDVLRTLMPQVASFPIHTMRSFTEKCLLPIAKAHAVLVPVVLQMCLVFFQTHPKDRSYTAHRAPGQPTLHLTNEDRRNHNRQQQADIVNQKHWSYFTKDVIFFMRREVLDNQAWKAGGDELLFGICELLISALHSGGDDRTCCRVLNVIIDLKPDANSPGMEAAVDRARKRCYTVLLQYVIFADNAMLPQRERDSAAYNATDAYVRLFPALSPCLTEIGILEDTIEEMHGHLLLTTNSGARRRKVKDFFLRLSQSALGGGS